METRGLAWITGSAGLIGNYLLQTAPPRWKARGLARPEFDLLDYGRVEALFEKERPGLIIHCAAISKNPACDANPELARRVNAEATVFLSELAEGIPFVFLSTDLVFDGRKGNYREGDAVNPLSVYAETKARAEEGVGRNPRHLVVRTSLNAGRSLAGNRSFNEEMRAAFREGRTVHLFEDEHRCPIPAEVTSRAIWEVAEDGGIYHLCGRERLSRAEIGELVAGNHPNLEAKIVRGSLRDYKGSPRSPDTSMDCGKIQAQLSFELPRFSEWVRTQPAGSV